MGTAVRIAMSRRRSADSMLTAIFLPSFAVFIFVALVATLASVSVHASGGYEYAPSITGLPAGRSRTAVAAIEGSQSSQVIVHGGNDANIAFDDLYLFDLEQNTATVLNQSSPSPSARWGHRAECVDGQFTLCQGFIPGFGFVSDCWKYNLSSNNWTELTNVSSGQLPKVEYAATTIDTESRFFLTFGGYNGSAGTNALWRVSGAGVGAAELITSSGEVPPARNGAVLVRMGATDTYLLLGGGAQVYQLVLTGLNGSWTLLTSTPGWDGFVWGIGMWDPVHSVGLFGFTHPNSNNVYISDSTGSNWTLLLPNGTVPAGRTWVGYASVMLANGRYALFGVGGDNTNTLGFSDAFLLQATTVPKTGSTGSTGGLAGTTAAAGAASVTDETSLARMTSGALTGVLGGSASGSPPAFSSSSASSSPLSPSLSSSSSSFSSSSFASSSSSTSAFSVTSGQAPQGPEGASPTSSSGFSPGAIVGGLVGVLICAVAVAVAFLLFKQWQMCAGSATAVIKASHELELDPNKDYGSVASMKDSNKDYGSVAPLKDPNKNYGSITSTMDQRKDEDPNKDYGSVTPTMEQRNDEDPNKVRGSVSTTNECRRTEC